METRDIIKNLLDHARDTEYGDQCWEGHCSSCSTYVFRCPSCGAQSGDPHVDDCLLQLTMLDAERYLMEQGEKTQ